MRYILIHDEFDLIDSMRVHIETYPDESIWNDLPSELLPPKEEWELGEIIMFESEVKAELYLKQNIIYTKFRIVAW
jgi:hypothetical protein